MSFIFPIPGSSERWCQPAPEVGPRSSQVPFAERLDAVERPDLPPPEVRAEVQAAARCAEKLHELGRQLRFDVDSETGRVRIEVCDLDGNVLRKVPPTEVFDFASGKVRG